MMVKICDRCGKKAERGCGLKIKRIFSATDQVTPTTEFDLCCSCGKELGAWIRKKNLPASDPLEQLEDEK